MMTKALATFFAPLRICFGLETLDGCLQVFQQGLAGQAEAQKLDATFWQQLDRVWMGSDYVAEQMARAPIIMLTRLLDGSLLRCYTRPEYRHRLKNQLADVKDANQLSVLLREFRHQEMVRIIWRDLAGLADVQDITAELSALADVCVDESLLRLYQWECERWGLPRGESNGLSQQLVVLGMGKLGAGELNLSSDIDLIFAYPEAGETDGKRSRSNQEFFVRLGQQLIKVLDERTAYGFVFRVDMRLRPYGQSGALVLNFAALEQYYQEQGREWERYALIKARVIAGDVNAGTALLQSLQPFIYRRYVDFGAFASLREMKRMIQREVQRRDAHQDIKIGKGGIREIEFIAQSFQLIRGGKDKKLQTPSLWQVYSVLEAQGYLPTAVVSELRDAYIFLRRCEHRIQALKDQQSQTLPDDAFGRLRLALSMGHADWDSLVAALNRHRQRVSRHFAEVVRSDDETDTNSSQEALVELRALWLNQLPAPEAAALLLSQGYNDSDAQALQAYLASLRDSKAVLRLQTQGRERLDDFMPLLIKAIGQQHYPSNLVERLNPLISAILRRSAYLALLVENPAALSRLLDVVAASPWLSTVLEQQPSLLDELIDSHSLFRVPQIDVLRDELRQVLLRLPVDDVEQHMEGLRHFQKANVFRVAVSEVLGKLPLMKISDYLTWTAEVVLQEALHMAWRQVVEKYGFPNSGSAFSTEPDFIVLAYGKMGGLEMGYGSDLDLVFVYDAPAEALSSGSQPVENSVFYSRLCQRLLHIMTTKTHSGTLYEIDQRLRPSGASGLLVSSMEAFASYQQTQAWTWEHQALVRARVVAGSPQVAERFQVIRRAVLGRARDGQALRQDVLSMREKMRQHAHPAKAGIFQLKHDPGGIVDIEFMVQYLVLRWAEQYPDLLVYTDNVRILETLAEVGLLTQTDADSLRNAYLAYRTATHRCALQNLPAELDDSTFAEQRAAVISLWQQLMLAEASATPSE